MFGITGDVVAGTVRHLFTTFGGTFVAKGLMTSDEVTAVGGAIAVLVGFVWSWISKKNAAPAA